MRHTGHVKEEQNAYRVLVETPKREQQLGIL
jgi:hypothetical protein